jgi:peptidoglycan-associated lipoprotein
MNNVSKKFCLVLASAMLVFAGCRKKPARPAPNQTVLGMASGDSLTPINENVAPDTLLTARGDGIDFGPDGVNRTALEPVYFDYDSSSIKQSERAKLQKAKEYLEQHPGTRLILEGHADWRGTAEYNLGLGDRRASAAKRYISTIGVPADKVETLSKGSLEAVQNADDGTAAKDRRVDLLIAKAPTS